MNNIELLEKFASLEATIINSNQIISTQGLTIANLNLSNSSILTRLSLLESKLSNNTTENRTNDNTLILTDIKSSIDYSIDDNFCKTIIEKLDIKLDSANVTINKIVKLIQR